MYQSFDKLGSSLASEIREHPIQTHTQEIVDQPQIEPEKESGNYNHNRSSDDFLAVRPGNLPHFIPGIFVKLLRRFAPNLDFICWIHE